jgi:hypothetical protein
MNRAAVRSSNIRSVGYDGQTLTLEVEFHNGTLYQYSGVPAAVHVGLLSAPSKGTYFHDHIRDRFPCRQVR